MTQSVQLESGPPSAASEAYREPQPADPWSGLLRRLSFALDLSAFVWLELVAKDWFVSTADPYPYRIAVGTTLAAGIAALPTSFLSGLDRSCAQHRAYGTGIDNSPAHKLLSCMCITLGPLALAAAVLAWRELLAGETPQSVSGIWMGAGVGATHGALVFAEQISVDWGRAMNCALAFLTGLAVACAVTVLLRRRNSRNSRVRKAACSVGIIVLGGLFLEGLHGAAFMTASTLPGTLAYASAIAAIRVAAFPQVPPAASRKAPRSRRVAAGIVPFFLAAAVATFTLHEMLAPAVAPLMWASSVGESSVALSSVSIPMQDATIAMEDGHFYQHHGFDFIAMHRALRRDLRDGRIEQGGSTITQQLAKNLFLTNDRTIWRKIEEAAYTVELEHDLSKRRILELYLNVVDYGMGQHGIGPASQYYFHQDPSQLTAAESACLVGMVPDPMHERVDPQRVAEGEETALSRMAYFFPQRYSQAAVDDAMAIPLDRLMYPFKDAWDRGATDAIPGTWHGVGFYFFADPDEPSDIDNVAPSLKPELAAFLDDARRRSHLTGIDHLGVFNDRPMRQSQTALSAHAFGQAIDISGFRFADGSHVMVKDHTDARDLPKIEEMEALLKKHFDIVVDWRDDPLRHQTHFHCEVRGPRPTTPREPSSLLLEAGGKPASYAAWASGANVPKRHPMSCGPAALATVLTYYLRHPVTEDQMMRAASSDGNSGTGLDQLQQASAWAGVPSQVVQMNTALLLQQLTKSRIPVLVLVYVPAGHFVDVIGRQGDDLLISDPNSGSKVMTVAGFTKIWRGDALIFGGQP